MVEQKTPLISNMKFIPMNRPSPGGASINRWFIDEANQTE